MTIERRLVQFDRAGECKVVDPDSLESNVDPVAILGDPGMGKTTLLRGLCEQADIVGRVNRGQTSGEPALATAMDLARLFQLQYVWPMEGIYNKAIEGATSSDYDWIGDAQSALLVYVNPQRGGIRMPQGMRTLTWSGYLGATENGLRMQKYRMQHLASDRAEAESAYDHVIMDNGMGLFLENMVE